MARDTKKIDAKGRFFIPSKQKEELGSELVVTNSLDVGYLCVYSKEHFALIREQLGKLNSMDPKVRRIKRAIIGEALDVNVDSQGRISVTTELWEKIGAKSRQVQAQDRTGASGRTRGYGRLQWSLRHQPNHGR